MTIETRVCSEKSPNAFALLTVIICAACANLSEAENSDSDIHLAKTPRAPNSAKIIS
jgi:hypothetical protein